MIQQKKVATEAFCYFRTFISLLSASASAHICFCFYFRNDSASVQVILHLHFNALDRKIPSYRQLTDILTSVPRDADERRLGVLGHYRFRINSVELFDSDLVYRQYKTSSVMDKISTLSSNETNHIIRSTTDTVSKMQNNSIDNTFIVINISPDEKDARLHKSISDTQNKNPSGVVLQTSTTEHYLFHSDSLNQTVIKESYTPAPAIKIIDDKTIIRPTINTPTTLNYTLDQRRSLVTSTPPMSTNTLSNFMFESQSTLPNSIGKLNINANELIASTSPSTVNDIAANTHVANKNTGKEDNGESVSELKDDGAKQRHLVITSKPKKSY